ncbi:MAG: histidine phosphatase family protein [Limosilactobacillus sp.]|uniref:histidine phosphatase family protein n=1 Tax=Limosilactobacillus sp. TaxID=2773925 RepID=UPI0027047F25|nr:histidine phosphatase family protein [Limosilactobacillus sp.]
MAITVYFVRHGQTYLNKYNRVQGWADAPLTEKGQEDAKRTGKVLSAIDLDYVFSSDLARTMATARLLLAANDNTTIKEPTPEPAFREEFFGYFEGQNASEFTDFLCGSRGFNSFAEMFGHMGPEVLKDKVAAADPYGDAEDAATFWARVQKGIDRLRALPDGSTALVVSHGVTIRSITEHFGYKTEESARNGSMTKITFDGDKAHVDFYNQLELPK